MVTNLQAYQDYLQKEKNYSSLTLRAYLDDIKSFQNYLEENHEKLPLEQINYSQVRSWIVVLVENGIANKSINRKISSLKSYYRFLLKIKQIEFSPLSKHKSLKVPKKVQIPFSEKELSSVLEMGFIEDDFESIRNKLVVELFYTTGIRRAELINLKTNNLDKYNKTLKVLGKRNKERIIPLLDCTIDLINQYNLQKDKLEIIQNTDVLILSKKGKILSETFVYRMINSYFSTISEKIKKSPHVLRHTFATHLLNNGADLNSVKELLGHASLSSTQIYTHSSLTELQRVYKDAHPRNK
ncbi:tyrosine-type recombinase/integrase [Flavobacterium gelidilacus]|uniref:tyrosine-type recombinase/integrase n=1 Tax=Flavobacterium gelidilacus TaxID=206041 RepID=UPI00041672F1|nr:tyrosine-type recombinase/integrase [Flavobacterium gelidilacus]